MEQVINYKNVDIHQGENCVLNNVDLSIAGGEMVYITGPVGSGKSSLLKTLYAELPCRGSKAEILGFDLLRMKRSKTPALRSQLGIVFQDFQILPDRTVHENLDFVLRATGWKKKDRPARIAEVLRMVKLPEKEHTMVYQLSGGEQQRVCIARALLNSPKVIMADEPTGNLDNENGELVLAQLDEVRRTSGTAIIVCTHNALWPQYFPGTVYRCEGGKLIKDETIKG